MTLFDRVLTTSEIVAALDDRQFVAAMLRFEAALAAAEAASGLVPAAAAQSIIGTCKVELFDVPAIVRDGQRAGTVAIPLVKALRDMVRMFNPSAERWVHFGSTSQDVMDSAMALVTRDALALVETDLRRTVAALLALAEVHAATPMLARTLLQPASVTTFGMKCAGWALGLARALQRIDAARASALRVQLGGAAGTRHQLAPHADAVVAAVAAELRLTDSPAAWHAVRDEWVALGCELGLACGTLGKMARDLSLLGQFEVAEVKEPGSGSSAMPHKSNPLGSMITLTAAQRAPQRVAALLAAMPQEHERALGGWQAECAEWGELLGIAHGAARAMATVAEALQVDAARMRANLEAVRLAVPADTAAEWFNPAIAETLRPQVARLCAAAREKLPPAPATPDAPDIAESIAQA
jgi:3-carboxy-cis,cis-muconate cycloisomerase